VSSTPILLAGAGGHARACIDVIESHGGFTVAGLVGTASEVGKQVLGYSVLGTDDDLAGPLAHYAHALVAVGHIRTPEPRMHLFALLQSLGFTLPAIVSPLAHVSRHATLGAGTIVMHGAIVNAGAVVGCNCIINSHSLVEHDAAIGDHCHIATAAVINGGVQVGAGSFIGSNAALREGVRVGERCTIGMGEQLLDDCQSGASTPRRKRHS
jgi:sugar O-acyltransferase (sialic acid O-acetyltransferase NeuD family)